MKKIHFILLLLIIFGCKEPKDKPNIDMSTNKEHLAEDELINNNYDPIMDYKMQIEEGNIEQAKAISLKYGVNYEHRNGENFFTIATKKDILLASTLLDIGYKMNTTDEHLLFQYVKSDTTLFSNIYLKYVKNSSSITNAIISTCDPKLLKYYITTAKPDFTKCSYVASNNIEYNCLCNINYCENKSVDMLRSVISGGIVRLNFEKECLVENWIQDFPMLSDSSLVVELLANNLIDETTKWTPLINYCRWNKNNIVQLLLKNGYNPNWNNSSDLLYFAITRVGDGFGEHLTKEIRNQTVELLLKYGANPMLNIKENIRKNENQMNFVEFANDWKFEDNTELVNIVNEYAR